MFKWLFRIGLLAILGWIGYVTYDWYMAGHHTRPEMPEGAFSLSYKNGLRGIVVDVADERETRRYFGFPQTVPHYIEDAWSWCHPPTEEEAPQVAKFLADRNMPGERFEAVCKVTADDDVVFRGLITSVPKL